MPAIASTSTAATQETPATPADKGVPAPKSSAASTAVGSSTSEASTDVDTPKAAPKDIPIDPALQDEEHSGTSLESSNEKPPLEALEISSPLPTPPELRLLPPPGTANQSSLLKYVFCILLGILGDL